MCGNTVNPSIGKVSLKVYHINSCSPLVAVLTTALTATLSCFLNVLCGTFKGQESSYELQQ